MAIRYLTMEDRERIGEMYEKGATVIEMAYRLGHHISTIYGELRRGQTGERDGNDRLKYDPVMAQRLAEEAIRRRGNRHRRA